MSGKHEPTGTTPPDDPAALRWDPAALEAKWAPVWAELAPFKAGTDSAKPAKYLLDMFPYPSGDLHMGHAEAYAIGDVLPRYWRLQGYDVLHPIGWDAFGLPAENAAIKRGLDPAEWTAANIETQRTSMRKYACAFDWDRTVNTCDPEYYRWTQWLFLQLYKAGLAYRKPAAVNWCPSCQTVLANEQVVQGLCERCDAAVTKKNLVQWYFKITDYAEELLADLKQLEGGWPENVLTMQRNWIGRSEGANIHFTVEGRSEPITVFTTRPDTVPGATFCVVAVDSDLAAELVALAPEDTQTEFAAYRERVRGASDIDRLATDAEKTGVPLGCNAINPVTGEKMPIWASDYVLPEYGHGAIMAVPAHDQRDLDFARAMGLPVRTVVHVADCDGEPLPDPTVSGQAISGDGVMINSGATDGLTTQEATEHILAQLAADGAGAAATTYRLRDWLISRQRYWGAPIPIVYCDACGEQPVADGDLPVRLPSAQGLDLSPKGTSPLGGAVDWKQTECPKCGGPATRDTDTMDTFVDSSWYFLRFCSPHSVTAAFDTDEVARWCPIDHYVGGITHAILHLLYARFFTKALRDQGLLSFDEPFERLLAQGMVVMGGSAMSKSRGNLVRLSDMLAEHGVDAVRVTMLFAGPPEDDLDWADVSPAGSARFLGRAWRLARDVTSLPGTDPAGGDVKLRQAVHKCVHECQELVTKLRFNVVIARVMELVNITRKAIDSGCGAGDPAVREAAEAAAVILSLVAPYTAEDMWETLGHQPCIASTSWPKVDESLLVEDTVTCIVQLGGKVKARLEVSPTIAEDELENMALAQPEVVAALAGRDVRKVIVRAPKVVNVVPA